MKNELMGSTAAYVDPAAAASKKKKNIAEEKKQTVPLRAPLAPQRLHRDQHRHGDRGGDGGDDGDDDGGGGDDAPDTFVPDGQICAEFYITRMTLYRWTNNPDLGFPPPIDINGRKFRSRRMIEAFKERALRAAIAAMADPSLRRKQPEALASEEVIARKVQGVRDAHARRAAAARARSRGLTTNHRPFAAGVRISETGSQFDLDSR